MGVKQVAGKAKEKVVNGVKRIDNHLPVYSADEEVKNRVSESVRNEQNNQSVLPNKKEIKSLDPQILDKNLGKIAYTLDKGYMQTLSRDYEVVPFNSTVSYAQNIRAIKIKKFVFNKNEQVIDCMKNVIGAFSNTNNTLAVVINRTVKDVEFYFVCKNIGEGKDAESKDNVQLLKSSFIGNFAGSDCNICKYEEKQGSKEDETYLKDEFRFLHNPPKSGNIKPKIKSISVLSSIPSDKSEKYISQGIEKIINGIVPKEEKEEYSVVFIADALQQTEIRDIIDGFESIATSISPFATHQFQNSVNESESRGEMDSLNESVSNSISKTHSVNASVTVGAGKFVSGTVGYGYSWGKTESTNTGTTKGTNHNIVIGSGESTTLTYKSYLVSDLLQKLEAIIKRLTIAQPTGMWKTAAYILAQEKSTAMMVAQSINGLINGDESFIESASIQNWNYAFDDGKENDFDRILNYVNHFTHPIFLNKFDKENNNELINITPTANVSTTELAKLVSLPKHSLPGIPVLECAEFGRTVAINTLNDENKKDEKSEPEQKISLGTVCHMYSPEKLAVELDCNSLASHTFITGSTGSGKSYTVYKMLSELIKHRYTYKDEKDVEHEDDIHFLVIEPAKGEYKNEFGKHADAVYGNNPKLTALLRINPFSFHGDTHILEHLDRLIEIFNVCWPMYAAMPAVLKEAVEKSYEDCGWNLTESTNKYGNNLYPTFADVMRNIRTVIDSSDYDKDNKGAYKGSLETRLRSLTNGINGQIFTTDELSNEELFDRNVIVDLSRVGSSDTKALIMGLLVLKLQEYRMNQGSSKLKHVTVLEEAHNLLKRTSTEQSSESANLIGKSVEMLTNSIAEMRSFGEGFIIADQAPGLLDMAVIRNTNTKIILRLPEQSDRELVGKSANLNDDQITELAKLPCGVAAVYQNEWVEPVLCKVKKFEDCGKFNFEDKNENTKQNNNARNIVSLQIARLLLSLRDEKEAEKIKLYLEHLSFHSSLYVSIERYIETKPKKPDFVKLGPIVSELLPDLKKSILENPIENRTLEDVRHNLHVLICELVKDETLRQNLLQCFLSDYAYNVLGNPERLSDLKRKENQ